MKFVSLIFSTLILFNASLAKAEIPSFQEFQERIQLGSFKCSLNRFLAKAEMTDHEAFKTLPSKQELSERFYSFYTETIYEGIERINIINPALAELVAKNSMAFPINYKCDFTSLGAMAGAYVGRQFFFIGNKHMNIGYATFFLAATNHSDHSLEVPLNEAWIKRILFHEHLHVYLTPGEKRKFVNHKRKSVKKNFGDDIVYALSNYAFRVPVIPNGREFPTPIRPQLINDLWHIKGWSKKISSEDKSPHVFTLSQCFSALYTTHKNQELGFKSLEYIFSDEAKAEGDKYCSNVDSTIFFYTL